MRWRASLALPLLLAAGPALGQLGAAPNSPVQEGVSEGEGAANPKGHYAELDTLPDWGGIWFAQLQRPGPDAPPPPEPKLKGEYLQQRQQWVEQARANNGVVPKTRSNCSPPGMPRIMRLAQYPYEFLFTPGRVTINQEAWMQTRTIWTDGRTHPEDPDPTFMGHSIGHWEGATLVVDTVGIDGSLEIDTGWPHSDKLHLVERIHLSPDDPDLLVNEITMTDPDALSEPFVVTAQYRRDRYGTLIEFQCAENDRNPVNDEGETEFL